MEKPATNVEMAATKVNVEKPATLVVEMAATEADVVEEEELANLRARQREFEELRNAELAETQRLEEQERRHRGEKKRRMKQQMDVLPKERETVNKVAARAYAQSYLQDLVPAVFGTLHNAGYFVDPVERDIEMNFMESLMEDVSEDLMKVRVSHLILDSIILAVSFKRNTVYTKLNDEHETKIRAKVEAVGRKPVGKPATPVVTDGEIRRDADKRVVLKKSESQPAEKQVVLKKEASVEGKESSFSYSNVFHGYGRMSIYFYLAKLKFRILSYSVFNPLTNG